MYMYTVTQDHMCNTCSRAQKDTSNRCGERFVVDRIWYMHICMYMWHISSIVFSLTRFNNPLPKSHKKERGKDTKSDRDSKL